MIVRVEYKQKPLTGLIRISQYNSRGTPSEYTLQLFHEIRGLLPIKQTAFRTPNEAIAFASTQGFQPFGWMTTTT
jgi:hypothetical protein